MRILGTMQTRLRLISAVLVGSILLEFGFMRSTERNGEVTEAFLSSSILYQVASMNRATNALAEFRSFPAESKAESDWLARKTEQCRLLLSQAAFPEPVDQQAVSQFLRDDPLLLVARIGDVDATYSTQVGHLATAYEKLKAATTDQQRHAAIADFDREVPDFRVALVARVQLLEQLEATAHAQLVSDQAATIRRLTLGLVGQAFLVITAIIVAVLVFRTQAGEVRTLQGLIPICSTCKRVRDDAGFWAQVESYLQEHTDARFTHGMCPDCMENWYPGLAGRSGAPPTQAQLEEALRAASRHRSQS